MANADHVPPSGRTTTSSRPYSGVVSSSDPTNEPGQYPVTPGWGDAIFGGPLPTGTGAPGTAQSAEGLDPTTEHGQLIDGLTGISHEEIVSSGAPGSQGAVDGSGGGTAIAYTFPNDGIGPYAMMNTSDDILGPQDSTQANDQGYASGGPQLPGLKGNEPEAGKGRYQPGGGGHVLRGGRAVRG